MIIQNLTRRTGWRHNGVFRAAGALFLASGLFTCSLAEAQQARSLWIQDPWSGETKLTVVHEPNTSLWNAKRITDYQESLNKDIAPPLGILTINSLNIEVPIYNGTNEAILNRGAGRIKGMAKMNELGNLGISGHRDGYFRGLKDIRIGDEILVQSAGAVERYDVSAINIVPKSDVSVLAPTVDKTLTLVTCYPFYFVGHAPQRYIVTAVPTPDPVDQEHSEN